MVVTRIPPYRPPTTGALTDLMVQCLCSETLHCFCVETWLLMSEFSRDTEAGSALRAVLAIVLVEDEVEPETRPLVQILLKISRRQL